MTELRVLSLLLFLVAAAPAQTVRIGVLGLFHPRNLAITPAGPGLVIETTGRPLALEQSTVLVRLSADRLQVAVGPVSWRTRRLLIHARDGGPADFSLSVPGKIHRRYRGGLEITAGPAELVPVVLVDQETAVASVVAAESLPGAPLEALKAQAVAARSFLAARAAGHVSFDFCDTTHCQFLRQPPSDQAPAALATRATRGLVLTWRGAVFPALYAAACGGRTRSLAELGLPAPDYPYFSVECPYCREHSAAWTRDLPHPLQGERERIDLVRQRGWSALPGNNFRLRQDGDRLLAEGSGLGHGLGLCERGAAALARDGQSFRQILEHYYPNSALADQAPTPQAH